ncbi:DUF559 domain-containing protein [Streptomyces sp. NPDC059985]|uniref:DUF559 domain-containing protein n=1 Tax=Streptomyces sp. NPDC059985 TaxID=3347025 RepID=UPI0036D1E74E
MPIIISCRHCGSELRVPPSQADRKYCSLDCYHKAKTAQGTVTRECRTCGGSFTETRSRVEQGYGLYCSVECYRRGGQVGLGGKLGRPSSTVAIPCANCGTEIQLPPSRIKNGGKYCSQECYHQYKSAQRVLTRTCQQCGDEFKKRRSQVERGKGLYCSIACASLAARADRIERTCATCCAPIQLTEGQAKDRGWYCSLACKGAAMTQQGTVAVPCRVCGTQLRARRSRVDEGRKLYCSEDCQAKDVAANKIYEERPCAHCGETMVLTHTRDVEDRRFCGWECFNLHRPTDPEVLERMARMRNVQLQQTKPTRCEEILYRLMDQVVPGQWEPQFRLFRWTVDAAVPERQLVVQADGDYWHGLTAAKSGQIPSPSVVLTIKKDRAQDKYLTTAGWNVLRLWESELKQDPEWCLRRIKEALKG